MNTGQARRPIQAPVAVGGACFTARRRLAVTSRLGCVDGDVLAYRTSSRKSFGVVFCLLHLQQPPELLFKGQMANA